MKKITIEVITTDKKEVEIFYPCFLRNFEETKYLGILDEKTVVRVSKGTIFSAVSNGNPSIMNSDIEEAIRTYHSCTEIEFLEAFDSVVQSMSLHPILEA
jgi:hypothetical protein